MIHPILILLTRRLHMQRSQPFCGEGDEAIHKVALRNTGTAWFFNHQQFTRCDAVCCLVGVQFPYLGLLNELKAFEHGNISDTKLHSVLLQFEDLTQESFMWRYVVTRGSMSALNNNVWALPAEVRNEPSQPQCILSQTFQYILVLQYCFVFASYDGKVLN